MLKSPMYPPLSMVQPPVMSRTEEILLMRPCFTHAVTGSGMVPLDFPIAEAPDTA